MYLLEAAMRVTNVFLVGEVGVANALEVGEVGVA